MFVKRIMTEAYGDVPGGLEPTACSGLFPGHKTLYISSVQGVLHHRKGPATGKYLCGKMRREVIIDGW